jgi:hypothetical protein
MTDHLLTFRSFLGDPSWDDMVVGHDFGFLTPPQIQQWAASQHPGPALKALCAVPSPDFQAFETHLWEACLEARGKTPRPGSLRWAQAQDRWRLAFLREALATESTLSRLAQRVERIYEQVGCPEDMLTMLRPSRPWSSTPATVNPDAVWRFIRQHQNLAGDWVVAH